MRTALRTAAVGVFATALVATAGTGSAGAAAAPGPSGSTATGVFRAKDTRTNDVITCKLTTHTPHYSHHADAENRHRVNVTADIKCSKKVANLSLRVALYKNGTLYKQSAVKRTTGKSKVSQNAARRCVKKQKYTGASKGVVTFPPNYSPPVQNVSHQSKTEVIRACKKK